MSNDGSKLSRTSATPAAPLSFSHPLSRRSTCTRGSRWWSATVMPTGKGASAPIRVCSRCAPGSCRGQAGDQWYGSQDKKEHSCEELLRDKIRGSFRPRQRTMTDDRDCSFDRVRRFLAVRVVPWVAIVVFVASLLADGTTTNRRTPVSIPGLSGVTAIAGVIDHTEMTPGRS